MNVSQHIIERRVWIATNTIQDKMKFSIIIPIYNVEQYLEQCIESVLCQTNNDYEIILVDDGSTDKCPEICDEYASECDNIVVIHNENGGASDARNAGIRIARGDFVCFIDSDDYWDSSTVLDTISREFDSKKIDVVLWQAINKNIETSREVMPVVVELSQYNGNNFSVYAMDLVKSDQLDTTAWKMSVSRDFLIKNDLLFVKGIKSEDTEWALRLFLCNPRISYINDRFYIHRVGREGSVTNFITRNHLEDYYAIIKSSIVKIEESNNKQIKDALMNYIMFHVLIASYYLYRIKEKDKGIDIMSDDLKKYWITYIDRCNENPRVKKAYIVYKILGHRIMLGVMTLYREYTKNQYR